MNTSMESELGIVFFKSDVKYVLNLSRAVDMAQRAWKQKLTSLELLNSPQRQRSVFLSTQS